MEGPLLDQWITWAFATFAEGQPKLTRHKMKLAIICLTGAKPQNLVRGKNDWGIDELSQYVKALNGGNLIGDARPLYDEIDQEGRGFVTLEDLLSARQRNNCNLAPEVLADAFERVDSDGDGRIPYRDFMGVVNTGLLELGVIQPQ